MVAPANQFWTGQAVINAAWTGSLTPSQNKLFGVATYSGEPQPLVLSIDALTSSPGPGSAEPALIGYDSGVGFLCGAQDTQAASASDYNLTCVGCFLEFGFGAVSQQVLFDWMPGSYQLPPCNYARVSAVAWGLVPSAIITLRGTLMPGVGAQKVPTRSQRHTLAAAAGRTILFSFYTRAIEVMVESGGNFTLSADQLYIQRAPAVPTFVPSWGPVPYMPQNYNVAGVGRRPAATLTNNGGAQDDVTVVEYLDLGG